jgi:hypothetical protein
MWETKWSVPWFDCDESLTWWGLNSNLGRFSCFTFIFVSFVESCLLVSWCAGGRCGMADSDEDCDRSRRPGAEDRGWSHISGTRWPDNQEVRWRRIRSAPCTWRQGVWVSWLNLKTKVDDLSVVWLQNHWDSIIRFDLKTGGGGFPSLGLKNGSYGLMIWASKSPRWFLGFNLKTKQTTIYRLRHKTDGRATVWNTRRDIAACFTWKQVGICFFSLAWRIEETRQRMVHVALSWRLRRV